MEPKASCAFAVVVLWLVPAAGAVVNHVTYGASIILPEFISKADEVIEVTPVTAGSGLLQTTVRGTTATLIALGSAKPGHVGVSVAGTVSNEPFGDNPGGVVTANVTASLSEFVVFHTAETGLGTPIRVHSRARLFGNMSATAGSFGAAHVTVTAAGQSFTVQTDNVSGGPMNQQAPEFFDLTLTMHNLEDFSLGGQMSITGHAQAGAGERQFFGNFRNSLHWGGIDYVENALTGAIINDWTITSESGTDYSQPVDIPEPSGLALLSAAALLGPVYARRKKA